MASIDVHMFLENLKQLMSSGLDFVASQRDELQIVYEYINAIRMLLESSEEEGSTDQKVNNIAMHIRDLVFEAETIVDLFVFNSGSTGGDCNLSTKLDCVKGKMEAIINICKHGKFELERWYSKAADTTSHDIRLRPEIDRTMCRFKHGKSLEIISIVGLPGTRNTSLAKQIYNDDSTKEKFNIQVWIKVGQGYRKRDFLAAILESLNPVFNETCDTNEEVLGAQLLEFLQDHKYLIVMNDMSTAQESFDLQTYLPDQCNGSKIIVTTWEAMGSKEIKEPDCYESDVLMFLEKLKQLLSSSLDFVASQRDELQIVYDYINAMSMLLKPTEEEGFTDKKVIDMGMYIRNLVFEAESIVDLFIVDSISSGGASDCDLSTNLDSVKGEMEAVIKRSKGSKFELEWWYTKAADSSTHVIGVRSLIDKITSRFKHGKSLEIISVMGLPGIGKTTLARQVYYDQCTQETFEILAWITVSQQYRKGDFLAATGEEALDPQLLEKLQNHRYLIVMDDMSTAQALFDIQTCLPDNCNGSKIIVTTRDAMVTKAIKEHDCCDSYAIRLDPLSEEYSWEIFRWNLRGKQTTLSKELEDFGKLTVKHCHGLPLAIGAISGVLALESETPGLWRRTANSLGIFHELYMENLECRYNQLPPHLKACLLYIGSFPEDYHIPVRELVWLLIAEGFITEEAIGIAPSPEVVAEGYISDLIDRFLVVVLQKRICGGTKTCCISSILREFCSAKVQESKFAYQDCSTRNDPRRLFSSTEGTSATRRSLQVSAISLRSFLCFGRTNAANMDWVFCGNYFKFIKVLSLVSIPMDYRDEIGVMVHLNYLAVQWQIIPETISNLFNLETLVLSKIGIIYLPPGILKMDKLRHIYNKAGMLCFSRAGILANTDYFGANLQTVYPLCGCRYCRRILLKFPRIKNLGLFQHEKHIFYSGPDNLSLLDDLETLKCCYSLNRADMNRLWGANFNFQLPSSIKRLTLKWTFLEWEMLSILGTLPNLEVLKLLTNACARKQDDEEGLGSSCWDIRGQEFPRLKCLKMRGLDITKWVGNDVEFKSLEVLLIAECDQLGMLPSGLARAHHLGNLEVKSSNGYVTDFFNSTWDASTKLNSRGGIVQRLRERFIRFYDAAVEFCSCCC